MNCCAGIVREIVIVEIVGHGESAGVDRISGHRPVAGELIFVALLALLFRPESEIVLNQQPRDVRLRRRAAYARNLAIRLIGYAVYATEAFSPRDLRIKHQERILLQAGREKQGRGE